MNPEENQTQNNKQEKPPIKSLRTFQGDVQEAIAKNNFSTATVFVAEQEKKLANPEIMQVHSKVRNRSFALYGITLICIGLTVASGIYYLKVKEQVVVEKKTKTLIAYTEEKPIKLNNIYREDFFRAFDEFKTSWNAPVNSVLYNSVLVGDKEASLENLLTMLGPSMPPSLVRSFGSKYMVGIFSYDKNDPFIILTVDDFTSSYPGMLKWEELMDKDLGNFFGITNEKIDVSSTTDQTINRKFIDETIKNKDIRALKDRLGETLFVYSFIDRKTLVITKDEDTLSAIVGSFIINKQTK